MPITVVDPIPALVVIDLQTGIVGSGELAHPVEQIVARSAELAAAFRKRGLPVVLVNVDGAAAVRTDLGQREVGMTLPAVAIALVPELDQQPTDLLITKKRVGAFHGTMLDSLLRERGVTQIVVTGVATTGGVEGTVRAGNEHGYHVVVATDACTDRHQLVHDITVEQVFPRFAETATTAEIVAALEASR